MALAFTVCLYSGLALVFAEGSIASIAPDDSLPGTSRGLKSSI